MPASRQPIATVAARLPPALSPATPSARCLRRTRRCARRRRAPPQNCPRTRREIAFPAAAGSRRRRRRRRSRSRAALPAGHGFRDRRRPSRRRGRTPRSAISPARPDRPVRPVAPPRPPPRYPARSRPAAVERPPAPRRARAATSRALCGVIVSGSRSGSSGMIWAITGSSGAVMRGSLAAFQKRGSISRHRTTASRTVNGLERAARQPESCPPIGEICCFVRRLRLQDRLRGNSCHGPQLRDQ